jgi:hypothetical protein
VDTLNALLENSNHSIIEAKIFGGVETGIQQSQDFTVHLQGCDLIYLKKIALSGIHHQGLKNLYRLSDVSHLKPLHCGSSEADNLDNVLKKFADNKLTHGKSYLEPFMLIQPVGGARFESHAIAEPTLDFMLSRLKNLKMYSLETSACNIVSWTSCFFRTMTAEFMPDELIVMYVF